MSPLRILRKRLLSACACAALLLGAAGVHAQQYPQPDGSAQAYDEDAAPAPGRVARLAYLSGQVQFAPAGEDDWGSVEINRPMVIGDRLLTGDDGRAALELGDASVRIDRDSAFDFLNLDENNVQIELSQGTLNVAVRDLADGENIEVDTPTVAFVATAPGAYRIDDSPTGTGTMVTVFRGSGVVYGENGVSREVAEGTSYRFNDSTLASVEVNGLPEPDDFDRFCETRDANYQHYASEQRQYVPPEMIGGDDLYRYGRWNSVPEYGNVWYPTSVPVGWAPYRYGHWAWIDPWGWTWVDDQPWGFAPFHYGRWVYVSNRWGWVPGPVNVRPVYAPALVAFIGGSGVSLSIGIGGGAPVGWFPLGPRDVYVPWFRASRGYFTGVNVTNIRNVYVNRTVINNFYDDYRHQRYADIHRRNHYRYRNLPGAVTVVPRRIFTDARPVHPAVLKLDRRQLARAGVAVRPGVDPRKASLGLRRPTTRPAALHGRQPFTRPVVARRAPPPRPVSFAAREKIIARQHGQPLTTAQMRTLRGSGTANEGRNERVKLVAAGAGKPNRATPGVVRARPATRPVPAAASARRSRTVIAPPSRDTAHSTPARNAPARQTPLRPGELRSARFRHAERAAPLPQPPALRAAGQPQRAPAAGRLPVVRPVEPAPQSSDRRTERQPRPADVVAQPRARAEPLQRQQSPQPQRAQQARQRNAAAAQQRTQQQQMARQQAAQREQQAQRQARAQGEQRAMQQRAQQQARVQGEQRAREQQAQRQRQVQVQQMRAQQAQQMQQQARQRAAQQPPQQSAPPRSGQRPPPPQRDDRHDRSRKHPDNSNGHR
jgi:hypothetical protein